MNVSFSIELRLTSFLLVLQVSSESAMCPNIVSVLSTGLSFLWLVYSPSLKKLGYTEFALSFCGSYSVVILLFRPNFVFAPYLQNE